MPLAARLRKLSIVLLCTAATVAGLATPPALADPSAPPAVGDIGVFYADRGLGNSAVLGPDGNIWSNTTYFDYSAGIGPDGIEVFSPTTRDVVARYNVSGVITSLTSGPDVSVWFTETMIGPNGRQSEIGEISMSGTITQHPLPASDGGQLVALAPDAAGNMWFTAGANYTDNSLGYVGYVAPNGTVTQYPMPALFNGTGYGHGMVAGANGLMWFIGTFRADSGYDQVTVASVTPTGAITAYPMTDLASTGGPASIAMGADGHPWLVLAGTPQQGGPLLGHYIGTIGDSGLHYSPLPSHFLQYDIAEGVDGNAYVSGYADGAGDHAAVDVVATYNGDSQYGAESADQYQQTVSAASTTLALTSTANPATTGQDVHITATLTGQGGGQPATGCCTISFTVDGGNYNAPLTAGAHPVTAAFHGAYGFGPSNASLTQTVNTTDPCPCTVFPSASTPASPDSGDGSEVELGVKLRTTVAGDITGVRFYKSTANTGSHSGSLWKSDGTLLASGTFTDETATGWQTLTFATPVTITTGATYIASYHAPNGNYSYDAGYFGYPHTAYPLTAPKDNGVYEYDGSSTYPDRLSSGTDYWVDAVFQPS